MRRLITAALSLAVVGIGRAQTITPSPDPDTLYTSSTLVVVPALVETPAKEVVYSLNAADFILTDNGVPQTVTLDRATNQPLSLVVLIQTGGSAIHQFGQYRNLETMLANILGDPPNQVSIVNFDSKPEAASPFSSNIEQWSDAINQPDPGDDGAAILDSLSFALRLLDQQPPANRRALLLLSEPTDVGSKPTIK